MLGITMGDPNGIGPEIITKLFKDNYSPEEIVVIGNEAVLKSYDPAFKYQIIDPFGELEEFTQGRATAQNGEASYRYVVKAIEMAKNREIEAIITAPINKAALHLAGIKFDGHTEILAQETDTRNFGMMFWSPEINIMLTTIHKALSTVPGLITKKKFHKTIELAVLGLKSLDITSPKIGVCGLNPHAGEGGIFGSEEQDVMLPVIGEFQKQGIDITGPYPADTLFIKSNLEKYDLIIAHYHDQGLIPLKMLAFDSAVNITVGLPIVRTSVDHGTAYDIVGQGIAHTGSLKSAINVAKIMLESNNAQT